jgi:chromosome segregation ATPase
MLFIILLMLLDMTTNCFSTPTAVMAVEQKNDDESLPEGIRRAQAIIAHCDEEISALRRRSLHLAQINPREIKNQLEDLQRRVLDAERKAKEYSAERLELDRKAEAAADDKRKLIHELWQLATEKKFIDSRQKRIVFALEDRDTKRDVVLVELSDSAFAMRLLASDENPRIVTRRAPADALRDLRQELKRYPPSSCDALVLLKPSAFGLAEGVLRLFSEQGYRFGYEPIEEDRSVLEQ